MTEKPVFYFTRMLFGYRVPVLECLNERLNNRLIVFSGQPSDTSSLKYLINTDENSFQHVKLNNWWLGGDKVHVQPFREAFRRFGAPTAVLAEESPRSVTLPFLLRYAKKRGSGRALWGHFSSLNRQFDPEHHPRDRYRLALARKVEACVCYTDGVANLLKPYLREEKLFVARNTIDLQSLFNQHDVLAMEGKMAVRKRLGIRPDDTVLVFMGRLVPQKGTQLLLETFARLRENSPATLLIIGAGPDRAAMEATIDEKTIPDVRLLGPLSDEEAAPYLFSADMMLMPGYLGLIINHAFAFGLPVVSRLNPDGTAYHSPEVEYIVSGENGILCEGNRSEDLLQAIHDVRDDLARFSTKAQTFAREHLTVDRMVDGLAEAISYAETHVKS